MHFKIVLIGIFLNKSCYLFRTVIKTRQHEVVIKLMLIIRQALSQLFKWLKLMVKSIFKICLRYGLGWLLFHQ